MATGSVRPDANQQNNLKPMKKEDPTFLMTKVISRGVVLAAGLLALPGAADPDLRPAEVAAPQTDPRLARIQQYFAERDCPAKEFAADFIVAADRLDLDWRLLPSISMIESTGGKAQRNNNMFGWDNCNVRFSSTRAGIYEVADRLANSSLYKQKDLDEVLWTYNPIPGYAHRVKAVMRELGPANLPGPPLQ